MVRIDRSPGAKRDLHEIWAYIEQDNRTAADRLIRSFDEKFRMLAAYPRAGKARDEFRPGLRSYPVGKYLIFYRLADAGIEIVRVLHSARNIERALDDL